MNRDRIIFVGFQRKTFGTWKKNQDFKLERDPEIPGEKVKT